MAKKYKLGLAGGLLIAAGLLFTILIHGHNFGILNPKGEIATKQLHLMIAASLLSLIVVIPVFVLLFVISWKYREGNAKARYTPDWDHNRLLESIWWGVPTLLILVLSIITWRSSHDLDPFKPIDNGKPPLTIQVVALDWKWLFIYPEQHIASVNFAQIPVDRPVQFEVTADAPMNSFWIPQLGGQIYAMSGMSMHLNLMADSPGDYRGSSANISGRGFAGMKFVARAGSDNDFKNWVNTVKQSPQPLSLEAYAALSRPSENNRVTYYSAGENDLYNQVVMKYMVPGVKGLGAL